MDYMQHISFCAARVSFDVFAESESALQCRGKLLWFDSPENVSDELRSQTHYYSRSMINQVVRQCLDSGNLFALCLCLWFVKAFQMYISPFPLLSSKMEKNEEKAETSSSSNPVMELELTEEKLPMTLSRQEVGST